MIYIILIGIALFILAIGSYTDFKTREVPDWINFSGIAMGIGIRLIYSVSSSDWNIIIEGLLGFGIFFVIALMMFYLGQWGGGDSKMLMGLGALLGFQYRPDSLLIAFFLNLLIVGAVYGVVWSVVLGVKHRKKLIPYMNKTFATRKYRIARTSMFVLVGCIVIIALFVDFFTGASLIAVAFSLMLIFYIFIYITAVEKTSMIKSLPIEKLTEGDWIVKDVIVGLKKICGPKDLGISKAQIKTLLKLKAKGKIRKVMVKEGMPFIPSFLIAFVIAVFWGNIVLILFL